MLRPVVRAAAASVLVLSIAVAAEGCSGGSASSTPRTVVLAESGTSGISGTATLSDAGGGQTLVVVKVDANHQIDMPTAITRGTCSAFDTSTVDELNDTRDGAGTTTINVALDELLKSPHGIHRAAAPYELSSVAYGAIQ